MQIMASNTSLWQVHRTIFMISIRRTHHPNPTAPTCKLATKSTVIPYTATYVCMFSSLQLHNPKLEMPLKFTKHNTAPI